MKKRLYVLVTCVAWAFMGFAMAGNSGVDCDPTVLWKCYTDSNDPMAIVEEIVNNDDSDIIETELDQVKNTQIYGVEFKLAGTLESVRQQISPYLQWIAFIWLSMAVILVIYNGVLLVSTPLSPDQATTVRKRLLYIIWWVTLITGFYFVLKILLSVYVDIFVK